MAFSSAPAGLRVCVQRLIGNVLADAQAIVKIMIVRTDAGIDTLEIRILYQTVMVEIVQQLTKGTIVRAFESVAL